MELIVILENDICSCDSIKCSVQFARDVAEIHIHADFVDKSTLVYGNTQYFKEISYQLEYILVDIG